VAVPFRKPATIEDLRDHRDVDRHELIAGEIVEKALPSPGHSFSEIKLGVLVDPFNRRPGGRGPGGWWIFSEIHTAYGEQMFCHDAAGWRRDRVPERPTEWPMRIRPDWVCEIVSPKHEARDLVIKPQVLHAAEVPHYWIVNPEEKILLVHRWSRDGYIVVQRATTGERVRAEPFEAIEMRVGELFGDEEDDESV
jgi:Uma2 family endonuclease